MISINKEIVYKRHGRRTSAPAEAIDFFDGLGIDVPSNLSIDNKIEFLVNDVATDGYNMYKRTFNF